MKKYNGKIISYGETVTGTVDFVKPLVVELSDEKVNTAEELTNYEKAVQNVKDFLWEKISSTNDKRYADALMIIEDPTFTNDIKKQIKKNKELAVSSIFIVSEKFKNMYGEINDKVMNDRVEIVKYIEYLLYKEFDVCDINKDSNEDAIYLVNSLNLYNLSILTDLEPKGIILKDSKDEGLGLLASTLSATPIISLEGNEEVFNEMVYGERVTIDTKDEVIIFGYEKIINGLISNDTNNGHNLNTEVINEFDNSPVTLTVYVNNVTKKIEHQGKNMVVNTNRLFLETEPTIEEQVEAYKNILVENGNEDVSFVLFNIDELNKPTWIDYGNYVNDLLVKGIRLSYLNNDLFKNQIEALIRVSKYSENGITILLPLVSTNEEFIILKDEIDRIKNDLANKGETIGEVKTSIVLETPSLGLDLSLILDNVDKIVLDIDEMTQYLMAIEKNNGLFKHLYQPLNPTVLKFIKSIINQAKAQNVELLIQGTSVNEPEIMITLMGLGAKNLVISKHFNEDALDLIKQFNNEQTFNKVNELLEYKTSKDVVEAVELYIEK